MIWIFTVMVIAMFAELHYTNSRIDAIEIRQSKQFKEVQNESKELQPTHPIKRRAQARYIGATNQEPTTSVQDSSVGADECKDTNQPIEGQNGQAD